MSSTREPAVLHLPGPRSRCGAPIVAVPGLGLTVDLSRRLLTALPTEAYAVALPGFGAPTGRGTSVHPGRLAGLLLDRLTALDVPRAVLIGHSSSCQVVAEAAARAPDRVAALVLVGPTTDPRAATWPRLGSRWVRTAVRERPWQVPLLLRAYARTGPGAMVRGMDASRRHRIEEVLASVRCPALVVRGEFDRIVPGDWAATVATAAGDGRTAEVPTGAHMIVLTHPEETAAKIRAFLTP